MVEQRERAGKFALVDHQRRRQQDEIAARTEGDAGGEGRRDQRAQRGRRLGPGRERRPRRTIRHQLHHREQATAAAHVANHRVVRLQALRIGEHARTERSRPLDQPLVAIGLDRRDAGRAGQRVPAVGQAGIQHAVLEACGNLPRQHDRAERRGGTAQSLGERHDVGAPRGAVALPGEPLATATEAAHDLIGDQRDTACRRVRAQRRPVVLRRDDAVGAGIGLHQHRGDVCRAERVDALEYRSGGTLSARARIAAAERAAIGIGRRHMADTAGRGIHLRGSTRVARQRHRQVGRTVIRTLTRDDRAARPPARQPRDAHGVFIRIGSAEREEHTATLETGEFEQLPRQLGTRRSTPGVGDEAQPLGLGANRGDEARMLMTEVAALGQAAHVEDAAAVGQIEMCASPTGDGRCVPLRLHAPAVQYGIALGAHALPRGSGADLCAHCAHQTV